ncbi:hypothetical protein SDC9_140974 [bioreactor metagenome]|uniref:Uncharacterized protein n=1 Tax=bioreactor metagenome TaxID=1076179 RepID=A0A645DZS8_9ZZZZ
MFIRTGELITSSVDGSSQTGKSSTDHQGQQFVASSVHTGSAGHGFIFTDGQPGTTGTGVLQPTIDVDSQTNRQNDQVHVIHISERVSKDGGTLNILNSTRTAREASEQIAFEQDADDLTKAEGHNGQIISTQSHDRQAQYQPGDGSQNHGDHQRWPETQHQVMGEWCIKQCHGIRTNGEEGNVAQDQLTRKTHNDVQAKAQDHIKANNAEHVVPIGAPLHGKQDNQAKDGGVEDDGGDQFLGGGTAA